MKTKCFSQPCHAYVRILPLFPSTPSEDDGQKFYIVHKFAGTEVFKPHWHSGAVCKQMCGHTDQVRALGTVHYCNELLAESSEHCALLLRAWERDPGSPQVLILALPLTCCLALGKSLNLCDSASPSVK